MKKLLVVIVALAFFGTTAAMAGISSTKHNLASSSTNTVKSADLDQICVFCHTPHGAATGNVPLWNRTASASVMTPYYTSNTINYTPGAPGAISLACLTCHDGAVDENLVNLPNGYTGTASGGVTGAMTGGNLLDAGLGLSNDHPVGGAVNMADISALDSGILSAPSNTNVRLFNGAVECASCHHVHDDTYTPFLAMSNAGSALCLSCHNK